MAVACSVPVFRYALEHWRPDPYFALVFHEGELTNQEAALLKQLQPTNDEGAPLANLVVRAIDLSDDPSDVFANIWKEAGIEAPGIVLKAPPKRGKPQTIWTGPFNALNVATLIDSPARQELSRRLLSGDSAVWIYLEGGDKVQDNAIYGILEEEISKMQSAIQLPEIQPEDLPDLSVSPDDLSLRFSALRVSRDDPAESRLVDMLLRVESDLLDDEFRGQPMAFPVFARGRALYALVDQGITPSTIEDACRFLTGECQCTIKADNPGVDLLIHADWDNMALPTLPEQMTQPTLTGLASALPAPSNTTDAKTDHEPVNEPFASSTAGAGESQKDPLTTAADVRQEAKGVAFAEASTSVEDDQLRPPVSIVPARPRESLADFSIFALLGLLAIVVVLGTAVLTFKSRA